MTSHRRTGHKRTHSTPRLVVDVKAHLRAISVGAAYSGGGSRCPASSNRPRVFAVWLQGGLTLWRQIILRQVIRRAVYSPTLTATVSKQHCGVHWCSVMKSNGI